MLLGILYAGGWKEIFLNIFGSLPGDRSKIWVALIWGYTNHFQDRNSKVKDYFAFTLVIWKGLGWSFFEPLGPPSMGVAL